MLHKTNGLILYTTKYAESGLIVKAFTREFGLQSYIVNSGKKKGSRNNALYQPLTLVEIQSTGNLKSDLQRITEISCIQPYAEIPYHIVKSSIVMFLNEMLYRSLKEAHPDQDLFDFLKTSLLILDLRTESLSAFHIFFLIQLSRYLGFYPQGQFGASQPYFDLKDGIFTNLIPSHTWFLQQNNSEMLFKLLASSYETFHTLNIGKIQRKELLEGLVTYYKMHIPSFGDIKSLVVLEEVIG